MHRNATTFNDLCGDFQAAAAGAAALHVKNPVESSLLRCVDLCAWGPFGTSNDDPNAVKLLLGVKDIAEKETAEARFAEQIAEVVVVKTAPGIPNILTSSLQRLLTITDPSYDYADVYIAGRDRLRVVLTSEESSDYLSSTPLEASFSWAFGLSIGTGSPP